MVSPNGLYDHVHDVPSPMPLSLSWKRLGSGLAYLASLIPWFHFADTDSDILGLGFLITSSIMWISNRGHVFCFRGIRLHPTGLFSNVLMTKKRHDNRKTSDWSKSDCSVRGRYQQRYLVYYKRYRNEFLQRRIWSETVSSDEI